MARPRKSHYSSSCKYTELRQTLILQQADHQRKLCLVVKSVFEKLLPRQTAQNRTSIVPLKKYNLGDKVYFKHFKNNVSFWELGKIIKRIGNVIYIIQGSTFKHKRYVNQIRKRITEDQDDLPQEEVEAIETVYDTFDIEPTAKIPPEPRRSGRKRKFTDPLMVHPKRKKY